MRVLQGPEPHALYGRAAQNGVLELLTLDPEDVQDLELLWPVGSRTDPGTCAVSSEVGLRFRASVPLANFPAF